MMNGSCQNPEKCAEEVTWTHNPHGNGWTAISPDMTNDRQGVCHMLPNPIRGNVITGGLKLRIDRALMAEERIKLNRNESRQ
jgi:hypothetical protein